MTMKKLLLLQQLLVVTPLALLANDPSHLPHCVICGLLALATAMALLIFRSAETARERAAKKSRALQAILHQLTGIWGGGLVLEEALQGEDEVVALTLESLTNTQKEDVFVMAARDGSVPLMKLLVSLGVDKDAVSSKCNRCTALTEAAKEGSIPALDWLLEAGANCECRGVCGERPLMSAAGGGHPIAVERLLARQVDVNARDEGLCSALHHAGEKYADTDHMLNGCVACVRQLLEAGAEVNALDSDGRTPLSIAVLEENQSSTNPGEFPIIEMLLASSGCDVNLGDTEGTTPLMVASRHSSPSVLLILLEAGADPTLVDHERRTAFHYATERNCTGESITDVEIADNYKNREEVMAILALASKRVRAQWI